jgi:hypothetical protein
VLSVSFLLGICPAARTCNFPAHVQSCGGDCP